MVIVFAICSPVSWRQVDAQQLSAFVELDAGRSPLIAVINGAASSIDVYFFIQTDDPILSTFANAVARGVRVRAIIEQCPGGTCTTPNSDAMAGCEGLLRAGVEIKWANQAFPKTHAKTMLIDGNRSVVTTINLEPKSFSARRDYGLITYDGGVARDFNRVFQQDWQNGDPLKNCQELPATRPAANGVQSYEQLIVSPDHGREQILGFIAAAKTSLKIQMEQIDPQNGRGIVPALVSAIKKGVQMQLLLSQPADQTGVQEAADAINLAGGQARFQSGLKLHAKMIIADGQRMFIGSQNLTQDSLDLRREIGWIVSDESAIACFQQVFDADWSGRPTVGGICPSAQPSSLAVTSSASYTTGPVAPGSLAALFGPALATRVERASSAQLSASLAGSSVQMRDSAGVMFTALLVVATPSQVNILVPAGLAAGPAQFTVRSSDGRIAVGTHDIASVAPGLFSANASGSGLAAGLVQTAGRTGTSLSLIAACQPSGCAANQIDVGNPLEQVYLWLFGTGIGTTGGSQRVRATVGGIDVPVVFAGPNGEYPGLDQVNLTLPATLAGKGLADIIVTVEGKASNAVQVAIR